MSRKYELRDPNRNRREFIEILDFTLEQRIQVL